LDSVDRAGKYFRVFKPEWDDPLDTRPSLKYGGRWNAPGTFGVLYLNATLAVAAANARHQHLGRAIGLFDLKSSRRPHLLTVTVPRSPVLDVVSEESLKQLRLPKSYPCGITWARCRPIGKRAYLESRILGIAYRSSAECTASHWLGEELGWFDRAPSLYESSPRQTFERWYPDLKPE